MNTIGGAACEFWTVAVVGSDERFDLSAFEFFQKVPSPPIAEDRRPNSAARGICITWLVINILKSW
ncbi:MULTISPECIES: hypothetical protein [Rhizobium]|uniref:Uncharacterized protein n=2 Tax=Rhizobium TaxID=379 RepID=A0A6N9ZR33_9HYPH|nr:MULTISPECIES: hypothetical protein [Rhizobium]MBB4444082.1 hypothetical protein [Rhizobium esperanzae]MDH6206694.1 hypothetical protein [Rhizobium leguminosarum]NEH95977.1 hypothetical protein [Rhizobium laguerreae]NEK39661.1 hypothetical protein [Rhizobium leguminosarum]NEK46832.1 hypothetical protein [Rhizobium leguminosarum]